MSCAVAPPAGDPVRLSALHALAFLVAGNVIGVLLAALLLAPRAGEALQPLSYGRWMPVHLDALLYGWGSLPLVALLLAFYGAASAAPRLSRLAVHAWSAMVIAGSVAWLLGGSSGKAFLDWRGGARGVLVVGMSLLTVALGRAFVRSARGAPSMLTWARGALLAVLLPVPFVLAWASREDVYPSINPDSGGPTGVSLLGSVLGIVAVFLVTPLLLKPARPSPRLRALLLLLAAHGLAFLALLVLVPGNRSHHDPVQVAALASTALWLPLLLRGLRPREAGWPREARPWLLGAAAWGATLVATGIVAFLPGVLERWKFSHALVAHAHVALAGLVTSWNMLVLVSLLRGTATGGALGGARAAWAWHAALVVHVIALAGLAALEQRAPGGLLPAGRAADALLAVRLAAGAAQVVVSWHWLAAAWRDLAEGAAGEAPGVTEAATC